MPTGPAGGRTTRLDGPPATSEKQTPANGKVEIVELKPGRPRWLRRYGAELDGARLARQARLFPLWQPGRSMSRGKWRVKCARVPLPPPLAPSTPVARE